MLRKKCIKIEKIKNVVMFRVKDKLAWNEHAHFHPSADVTPSSEDKNITEVVARSGKLINIKLLDHIIIGKNKIYSFKEAGLIP